MNLNLKIIDADEAWMPFRKKARKEQKSNERVRRKSEVGSPITTNKEINSEEERAYSGCFEFRRPCRGKL